MYYEADILLQRGGLGNVWIAAHWDKKLSKNAISQYSNTDIVKQAGTDLARSAHFYLASFRLELLPIHHHTLLLNVY